jgi:3-methyladenine DNA glycosylase AlkD
MQELESLGSAQTVKTYRRHGVVGPVFGVSYADLGTLKKRLKTDHTLARDLWATGNHDARVLATMVADPAQATDDELDSWLRAIDSYALTGAVAGVAAQHPGAQRRADRWMADGGEWTARAGWQVVANLALNQPDLSDEYFAALLDQVETHIHTSHNRVRDAMNDALIAIGARNQPLRERAIAAARRIGTVVVDHGDTACKTADAVPYIEKVWARRAARAK